jgi:hypothetical protein
MKHNAIVALTLIVLGFFIVFSAKAQAPVSLDIDQLDATGFPEVWLDVTVRKNGIIRHGLHPTDFAVFEDNNPQNVLARVEEISTGRGVAISIVFDFDPASDPAMFRPMQEWSQRILDEFELGSPAGITSHIVEIRTSSGKVLTPFTSDAVAAKNGIRQMVVEDMNGRDLNETLLEILKTDTQGRKPAILVIGTGGDVLTLNNVVDRALQKNATINTVAFSDNVDPTYMSNLAGSAGGQYFGNPDSVTATEVAAGLFSNFRTFTG